MSHLYHENTVVRKVDPLHPSAEIMEEAAALIRAGQVVAFPTETVYGLGADATSDSAISKIYEAKGRPRDNPLIAHFSSINGIKQYTREIPDLAYELANLFWPGPLTMVLLRNDKISPLVTQNLETLAVRIPAHQVALSFIDACGVPIAAPSANLSGKPSPTTAQHVLTDLHGTIPLVLDGGSTMIGVESTVINLTTDPPLLLRPGGLTLEELQVHIPDIRVATASPTGIPASPGMKYKHYSPDTKLLLIDDGYSAAAERIDEVGLDNGLQPLILCTNPNHVHQIQALQLGESLKKVQVNIFAALRLLDEQDFDIGVFEGVGDRNEGFAIMNRIRKAAHQVI